MKLEITVPEVRELINEISQEPGSLFDVIRVNVPVSFELEKNGFLTYPVKSQKGNSYHLTMVAINLYKELSAKESFPHIIEMDGRPGVQEVADELMGKLRGYMVV